MYPCFWWLFYYSQALTIRPQVIEIAEACGCETPLKTSHRCAIVDLLSVWLRASVPRRLQSIYKGSSSGYAGAAPVQRLCQWQLWRGC